MFHRPRPSLSIVLGGMALIFGLSACNRAGHVGRPPSMSQHENSAELQAMLAPDAMIAGLPQTNTSSASLWSNAHNSLVADSRASSRGDILTVVIEIDDEAEIQNSSGRSRSASDEVSIPALAGLPQRAAKSLPEGASMEELIDAESSSTFKGSGNTKRRDKMTLRIAATVVEQMPNGVLRIEGSQEVRVNFEMRILTVSGFVRPSDIGRKNEIAYDRIAGARISYGGKGQISDMQQPRYGQQIADILLPY